MADRPNRLRPFRFWLPFWANPSLTPPRPPIPTRQQPLPQTPASTPLPPAEPQHPSQTQPKSPPAPATPQLAIQKASRSPSPVANQVESQILSQPPSPSSPPKSPIGSTSPSNQPELLPHESPTLVQTKSPTQLQPHALPQTQETNPIQSASKPTDDHPARDPESKPYPSISEKETKQTQEEKPRTIPEPKPDKQPGKLLESEAHSEPASKEQPETKNPESDRLAEGFKGKLETEPEIEPQKPQNEAGKIIAELRISKPGHSKEQDNVDREESAQNGSGGKENKIAISTMPWASSSDGERAPFEKEIEKRHSRLVQKVGIGERMGNGQPVSMITLAGENNGASMVIGSHIHIHRGFKHPKGDVEASYDDPAITATINSNAQSINNSTFHGSSCNERDPGVHLKLSSKKVEAASLRRQPEPLKPQKTDASLRRPPEPIKPQKTAPRITPEQKPSHEPRIRRRCLRALFMESSDSDPENPQKPQRHGCRFCCDEKKKEKADIGATSTANGNARARQAEEGTSRA